MRCYQCGNKVADRQEECPTCHAALWAISTAIDHSSIPSADPMFAGALSEANRGRNDLALPPSRGEMASHVESMLESVATTARAALANVIPMKRSVCGRVILAEASYSEQPNWDLCKTLTRILWIILLLLSPFLILYWLLVKVGGLPAIMAIVGVFLLIKFVSPTNLYAMFRIFSILNPTSPEQTAQVPVRYFRIREDGSDREVMVRMKGQFTHGNIGVDDLVTLQGRFRRGTLYAQDGYNHRTESTIRLARSYSWVGLILTMLVILALVGELYEPTVKVVRTINSIGGAK